MSSAKDTFEPNTFEANTFACGTWRGTGVAVVVVITTPLQSVFLAGARAGALFADRAKQSVYTSYAQAGQTRRGEV